jgi:hypothetical protein
LSNIRVNNATALRGSFGTAERDLRSLLERSPDRQLALIFRNAQLIDSITPTLITFNEASKIARALDKLRWARRIVVVDSGSSDGTLEILAGYPQVSVACFCWCAAPQGGKMQTRASTISGQLDLS